MPKGFQSDRQDVLLGMYGYFLTSEEGRLVSAADLKQDSALLLSSSYIALLLESLQKKGLVEGDLSDNDIDLYTLNESGILAAEAEVGDRGQTLDDFEISFRRNRSGGRIVDTDHTSIRQAKQVLAELTEHLKGDNDIGELTPEDRSIALIEVAELQETISKPKIRTHYLWDKANRILLWIVEKGAGSVVAEFAKRALSHIHSFVNVFFN
jgi:DNA-binding PadR family transcriptional regulator